MTPSEAGERDEAQKSEALSLSPAAEKMEMEETDRDLTARLAEAEALIRDLMETACSGWCDDTPKAEERHVATWNRAEAFLRGKA